MSWTKIRGVTLRVLKYLKGCPDKGLFFPRSSSITLQRFSDADWAGCIDTRRSIFGQCFFSGNSLISWSKSLSQDLLLKLSGYSIFSKIYTLLVLSCQCYIVTIKMLFILQPILFFMSVLNI